MRYNGKNSSLLANATKTFQLKTKISEIKDCALCLDNISKGFPVINLKKKTQKNTGLKGFVRLFIGLLTGIVYASNRTKCVLLSNHKCMIQSFLINLYPND